MSNAYEPEKSGGITVEQMHRFGRYAGLALLLALAVLGAKWYFWGLV